MRRICLVGAGNIARIRAEVLRQMPEVSVVAVADSHRDAAEALARLLPGAMPVGSAQEALAAGGFDAAHVLTPPDTHAFLAMPLLTAGCDVLLEKPMAVSREQCERAGGRRSSPPSRRDLLSRGLSASVDCSDAKRDLGWVPIVDPARFREAAFSTGT